MPEAVASYTARVHGLWNSVHRLSGPDGEIGTLAVNRGRAGWIVGGRYTPVRGEVLVVRRDPGLLRSQFSLWTEGREWLGSSLRWHFTHREIVLHTGSRPLRLLPLPGFRLGWTLHAPRTGEMARILCRPWRRASVLEVYRKLEPELLLFSYFLGWQVRWESVWPGSVPEDGPSAAAPAKAPAGPGG